MAQRISKAFMMLLLMVGCTSPVMEVARKCLVYNSDITRFQPYISGNYIEVSKLNAQSCSF